MKLRGKKSINKVRNKPEKRIKKIDNNEKELNNIEKYHSGYRNINVVNTFINGFVMGMADIIPGISGATIALILNFYDKLIDAFDYVVSHLFSKRLFSKQLLFLINLYFGVAIGMIFLGKIILKGFESYRAITYAIFVGVIIGSIVILFKKHKNEIKRHVFWLIIGIISGYLVLSLKVSLNHDALNLLISGIAAISAMLLPGISGSYVLVMLGQYEFILNAIKSKNLIIGYFIIGILIGLALMSKLIKWLISKYHDQTISFLIGLMIIGLKTPFNEINKINLVIIGSILLGIGIVFLLHLIAEKKIEKNKKEHN